jgi:hypothetical protein
LDFHVGRPHHRRGDSGFAQEFGGGDQRHNGRYSYFAEMAGNRTGTLLMLSKLFAVTVGVAMLSAVGIFLWFIYAALCLALE